MDSLLGGEGLRAVVDLLAPTFRGFQLVQAPDETSEQMRKRHLNSVEPCFEEG